MWTEPGYFFYVGKPPKETENPIKSDNENLNDIYVNIHNNKPTKDKESVVNDKNEKTRKSYEHEENSENNLKKTKHGHKDKINSDSNKGQVSANVWDDLLKNVSRSILCAL